MRVIEKIVITGATGVIGRALITEAIRNNKEVLAIVHKNSVRAGDLETIKGCKVLKADLNEYEHVPEFMKEQGLEEKGYEIFFHLAWMAPFGDDRNNLDLQLNNVYAALEAVKLAHKLGCHSFVGAGSQAEYGRVEGVLSPNTPTYPETGYGIAKLCAGQMTRLLCEQIGIRHMWTRILSVYGPYDRKETLISTAITNMLKNVDTYFTPCKQIWDYIYSEDAARAIYKIGEVGRTDSVYVIGSGQARQLSEYIKIIADLTGYNRKIGFGKRPYNAKQVMHLQADITVLKDIGFEPAIRFEEGVARLIRFHRKSQL